MSDWISLMAEAVPAFVLLSLLLPVGLRVRRKRWAYQAGILIVLYGLVGLSGYEGMAEALSLLIEALSVLFLFRWYRESTKLKKSWLRRIAQRRAGPLTLAPPFEGQWKALSTGPYPATNHHLMARDQWFAVDWVRVDAPSRGSRILSPVNGVVVRAEDGHPDMPPSRWKIRRHEESPAGNYLSIRVAGGDGEVVHVILAHLEKGSQRVAVGQEVKAGDWLASCGNSGNTTVPHVHIHAQPGVQAAPRKDWGIPVAFAGYGKERWTKPGEILVGGTAIWKDASAF